MSDRQYIEKQGGLFISASNQVSLLHGYIDVDIYLEEEFYTSGRVPLLLEFLKKFSSSSEATIYVGGPCHDSRVAGRVVNAIKRCPAKITTVIDQEISRHEIAIFHAGDKMFCEPSGSIRYYYEVMSLEEEDPVINALEAINNGKLTGDPFSAYIKFTSLEINERIKEALKET